LRSVQESSASSDENQPNDEQTAPLIITAQSILNRITAIEQKESRIPYLLCSFNKFHPPWEALTHILAHTTYILAYLTNPANDKKNQKSLEKIPKDLEQLQYWRSHLENETQFSLFASSGLALMIALPFILFTAGGEGGGTLKEAITVSVGLGGVFSIPFILGTIALISLLPSLWRVAHLEADVHTLIETAQTMLPDSPAPAGKTEAAETVMDLPSAAQSLLSPNTGNSS